MEDVSPQRLGGVGAGYGFRMIQVHYIYYALYFYYYYISSTSDHQALDPGGGGPTSDWVIFHFKKTKLKVLRALVKN